MWGRGAGVGVGVGRGRGRGVGSGRGSTLRTCGAQLQSARGAAALISCDEVRSASPGEGWGQGWG